MTSLPARAMRRASAEEEAMSAQSPAGPPRAAAGEAPGGDQGPAAPEVIEEVGVQVDEAPEARRLRRGRGVAGEEAVGEEEIERAAARAGAGVDGDAHPDASPLEAEGAEIPG